MTGSPRRWQRGQVVRRREVLGLDPIPRPAPHPPWYGRAWAEMPAVVVADTDEHLATYFAPGAQFRFPSGEWPIPGGVHPWDVDDRRWQGHGCLMVQRPGDHHAVWHFWDGPDRDFVCWYVNLQTAFVRTDDGYDTQDLELDIVVSPDGTVTLKDDEVMDQRVDEGRFTGDLVSWVRRLGDDLLDRLGRGERWWDPAWADWEPDPDWVDSRLA